jgi:hypothetical protein
VRDEDRGQAIPIFDAPMKAFMAELASALEAAAPDARERLETLEASLRPTIAALRAALAT